MCAYAYLLPPKCPPPWLLLPPAPWLMPADLPDGALLLRGVKVFAGRVTLLVGEDTLLVGELVLLFPPNLVCFPRVSL